MNQETTIKGLWFLPEKLEKKVSGTLFFNPYERITLELIGSFDNKLEHLTLPSKELILGISTKGEKITLCKCQISNIDDALGEIPEVSYLVQLVLVGDHFNTDEAIIGFKISARFDLFEKWVNIYSHKIQYNDPDKIILTSQEQQKIEFNIGNALIGRFAIRNTYDLIQKPDFHLSQYTFLELETSKGLLDIFTFIEKLAHFRNFLMIGIGEEISIYSINLLYNSDNETENAKSIKVYYTQNRPKDDLNKLSPHNFMFTYRDIECDFENIISNWFQNEKLKTITTMVNLFYQNRKSYSENLLLDGVLGLELFHRRLRQNTPELKADFKLRLESICRNLEGQDCKFITEKLEYGYEPTLRKRLKDLLAEFDEDLLKVFFKNESGKMRYIDKVTTSRNYYTHYSDSSKKKAAKGTDLFLLAKKTNFILVILLLKEIGFSIEEIKKSMDKVHNRVAYFIDK